MYNAPAVHFPVGRSWVEGSVLALLWGGGAISAGFWQKTISPPYGLAAVVAAIVFVAGLAAVVYWRQRWVGVLHWDRQKWRFAAQNLGSHDVQVLTGVCVDLDFQGFLLVSFKTQGGKRVTFWLDRAAATDQWKALRRALYARPRASKSKTVAENPVKQGQVT